jgi:hypothetical protein
MSNRVDRFDGDGAEVVGHTNGRPTRGWLRGLRKAYAVLLALFGAALLLVLLKDIGGKPWLWFCAHQNNCAWSDNNRAMSGLLLMAAGPPSVFAFWAAVLAWRGSRAAWAASLAFFGALFLAALSMVR